ncbi:MAG: hypothetical protein ABH837_03855 [bacterium]
MKKYIIFLLAVLTAFLFYTNPKSASAIALLSLSPNSEGSTGIELTIKGEQFCVHNAGFPVTVMWDGAPINVVAAPSFEIKYTVPSDTTEGSHIILAIANCPGQLPAIPPSVDQATTTYTVVVESEDTPSKNSTGDETDTKSEEDEQATTIIADSDQQNKEDKENKDESTSNPWYSNWVYLGLLGLGLILLIVGIVLIVRSKKNKSSKSELKSDIKQPIENRDIISKPQLKTISKPPVSQKPSKDNTPETIKSRVEYEE